MQPEADHNIDPGTVARFDRSWVRDRLAEIFGPGDPRVVRWEELASEDQS